jgi:uncharacterized membrane protein
MRILLLPAAVLPAALLLASCAQQDAGETLPGNTQDEQPFAAIGEDEAIRIVGTEPFWAGEIAGQLLTWSTPEDIEGREVPVTRFAGRGGLAFSGQIDGQQLDIAITPATCSDGMSDRTYPLVATVQLGGEQLQGCGWSDSAPYSGGE